MAEGQRQYTEDDKATALAMLAAHDGNLAATQLATGIPDATIAYWRDGGGITSGVTNKLAGKKVELADAFERIAERAIAAMTDTKMLDAPLNQLGTVAGIAVDKMRLLREQATPDAVALAGKSTAEVETIAAAAIARLRGDAAGE